MMRCKAYSVCRYLGVEDGVGPGRPRAALCLAGCRVALWRGGDRKVTYRGGQTAQHSLACQKFNISAGISRYWDVGECGEESDALGWKVE